MTAALEVGARADMAGKNIVVILPALPSVIYRPPCLKGCKTDGGMTEAGLPAISAILC